MYTTNTLTVKTESAQPKQSFLEMYAEIVAEDNFETAYRMATISFFRCQDERMGIDWPTMWNGYRKAFKVSEDWFAPEPQRPQPELDDALIDDIADWQSATRTGFSFS